MMDPSTNNGSQKGIKTDVPNTVRNTGEGELQKGTFADRLNELATKPKRHPAIHWAALVLSIVSLVPLIFWLVRPAQILSSNWYWWDVGFSVFFILEFVTRSGFRWNPSSYTRSHFFDFIAIVPGLVLAHFSVPLYAVWIWIILIARVVRALDRVLGDGFIPRNVMALVEGFEEEITDRVTIRILDRTKADLERGKFASAIGEVIERNKAQVLGQIHEQHPTALKTGIAHVVGINSAVEKAEEQVYDSIVRILKSPAIDKTIRESVNTTFSSLRQSVGEKSWKKNLGFRKSRATDESA